MERLMLADHMAQMNAILSRYPDGASVLDVGSLDVNGTFRTLVEKRRWTYTGLDVVDGPNVDVVSTDEYRYPYPDEEFDIVISGSTMEHVPQVWVWVDELVRLLAPGGMLALITHTSYPYHPHPFDCWRIMPDGMHHLFDRTGLLHNYDIQMFTARDISGVAWRIK